MASVEEIMAQLRRLRPEQLKIEFIETFREVKGGSLASWQAYVATWTIRIRLKSRLRRARDLAEARRLLTPPPVGVSKRVRIAPGALGGVSGEWVEGSDPSRLTLIYLHGGGYYACSPETHRR